jgi:hypothetical protein
MNDIILGYQDGIEQLKEADILLWKGSGFPRLGFWIKVYTKGMHSHCGLTHFDGIWKCVEMRELKGGREVSLKSQVLEYPNGIDVYRASPSVLLPEIDDNGEVEWFKKEFTPEIARAIVMTAQKLTGSPYGWKNFFNIVLGYAPFARLASSRKFDDTEEMTSAHVCSTLVAYSYRIHYTDPCPMVNDSKTQPADLERSSLFHKIFTFGEVK